jgi:hypothetical protein
MLKTEGFYAFWLGQYFTLIISSFKLKTEGFFLSNMEMRPPVNRMPNFYAVYRIA